MTDLSRRNEDDCRIRIEALPLLASIGVYPRERAERQLLRVDIEFIVDAATASRSDDIAHTVDYDQVIAARERPVGERHFNLLDLQASQKLVEAFAIFRHFSLFVRFYSAYIANSLTVRSAQ